MKGIVKRGLFLLCLNLLLVGNVAWAKSTSVVSFDDPWESFNRSVFDFNDKVDSYVLRPVALKYETYTPNTVKGLVGNFFSNLGDIRNFANALLQLKLEDAGVSLLRFALNSTIGQLGLVDLATPLGIKKHYQDFGITLARWGLPSGPYLVLPFLGPSTLRSATGLVPDSYTYPPNYADFKVDFSLTALHVTHLRANALKSEQLIAGDKYTFMRDAYLQQRQFQITGKQPQDDF